VRRSVEEATTNTYIRTHIPHTRDITVLLIALPYLTLVLSCLRISTEGEPHYSYYMRT